MVWVFISRFIYLRVSEQVYMNGGAEGGEENLQQTELGAGHRAGSQHPKSVTSPEIKCWTLQIQELEACQHPSIVLTHLILR